jgi:YD repeat-containing protein
MFSMRKFTYDDKNNLISSQNINKYNDSYTTDYDKGHSKFTEYTYDKNGQLLKMNYSVGSDIKYFFEFDANKNMTYMEAKVSGKFWYSFENKYDDKKQMLFFDPEPVFQTRSGNESFPYYIDDNIETPFFGFGKNILVVGNLKFWEGKNNQIYSKFTMDRNQDGKLEVVEIRNDFEYDGSGNPISYKRYFNNVFSGNEMTARYICK